MIRAIIRPKRIWIAVIILMVTGFAVYGQNQQLADSLTRVLELNQPLSDSAKTHLIYQIMLSSSAPEDILYRSKELEVLSRDKSKRFYLVQAFLHRGIAYRFRGDMEKSLQFLFRSATLALDSDLPGLAAEAYMEVAATYTANDNIRAAVSYERKGIELMRQHADDEQLAISLLNIGFSYYTLRQYDSALIYYSEADPIFDRLGLEIGKAYLIGNQSLVYWKQQKTKQAEKGLLEAIDRLQPLGDIYGMADYHNQLGNLYLEQDQISAAKIHGRKALKMATANGLNEQIRDAMQLLSTAHRQEEDYQQAYQFQTGYLQYKDSIENLEQVRKLADLRQSFEVNLREKEIDLLEQEKRLGHIYIFIAIILLILAIVLILYMVQRNKNAKLLAEAKHKKLTDQVDELLTHQESKALAAMVQGQENERKRLAHDLHNHFGSLLATIKVNVNAIEENSIPNHGTITQLVDQACTDMRSISHSLNMGISSDFGLVPALSELADHLRKTKKLVVELDASTCHNHLDSKTEITVYRIVQELVSNCLKHANASRLTIMLTCFPEENLLNILVEDNGKGFDPNQLSGKSTGMGIKGLYRMVEDHNGQIHIDSNRINGTTVTIDFPFLLNEDTL